jgi:SAM-dependent methyltransferase
MQHLDIFGQALNDYASGKDKAILWLHNSYDLPEEMPLDVFFREEEELSELEIIALSLCDGLVLDIGAGTGLHATWLQRHGMQVHALEHSTFGCQWMLKKGIIQVIQEDFFYFNPTIKYDTLLFLMNGIGITGTIAEFELFLKKAKSWLNPGGQLIFDSSNIEYLYDQDTLIKPTDHYFGEITYQYEYKGVKDKPFKWLYIDMQTLIKLGHTHGWVVQILYEDDQDQYLARMELRL